MATTIRYKGVDIGTVEAGKTARIKCSGKKMKDNIVVSASPLKLQEKTVTENKEVTPDEGFEGLSKVTVNVKANKVYGGSVRDEIPILLTDSDGLVITDSNGTKITLKEG